MPGAGAGKVGEMVKVKGMYRRGRMWWLRYTPAPGRPQVREKLGTHVEQVAAAKAIAILHRAPLEVAGEYEQEVEAYMAEVTAMRRISETFAPTRRATLLAFARDCGVKRLSDLSLARVERWVGMLKEGGGGEGRDGKPRRPLAAGTIEGYVFSLRAFGRWLVKKERLRENPAAKIELGKVSRSVRKDFVSAETVRTLIERAPTDELRFVLYCGFHAGMRKLEIVEARVAWFRFGFGEGRGRICVGETPSFRPKDRDERTIPLSREFEEFLRGYLKALPAGAEFCLKPEKKKGKARYRYDFRKPFESHLQTCGVRCLVHDMRRTFVSLKLIKDSSLIFKLAKWTGDEVRVLQDHYGHLLADDGDIETGL